MRSQFNRVLLNILIIILCLSFFSAEVFADNITPSTNAKVAANTSSTTSQYTEDWRYWSQGASQYTNKNGSNTSGMRKAGCRVVSQAKLLVEAGIAPNNVNIFNPDIFFEWGNANGYFGTKGDLRANVGEQGEVGCGMLAYAKSVGTELIKGHLSLNGYSYTEKDALIMQYLNDGYYVIIGGQGHHAYVGREESLRCGTPIIWDSGKSWSYSPDHRREGTKYAASINSSVSDNLYYYSLPFYHVQLDYNGGWNSKNGSPYNETIEVKPGNSISLGNYIPQIEFKDFIGWSRNPDATAPEFNSTGTYTPTKSETLYAVYQGIPFTVVYHSNTNGLFFNIGETTDKIEYVFGTRGKLISNAITSKDKHVASWTTNRNGTGKKYEYGQFVDDINPAKGATIHLYAQWANGAENMDYLRKTYEIDYDPNGGSGSMEPSIMPIDDYEKLRPNTFTRTGYSFTGWSGSPNGSVKYTDQQYVYLANSNVCVTLYAQWQANGDSNDANPAISSIQQNMIVNVGESSTLRFCSTTSTDKKYMIDSINNGKVVFVYGTTINQYENRTWAKINYDGTDGWVNYAWLAPLPGTPEPSNSNTYEKPSLSISEDNAPSELTKGSNFGIRGVIKASCGTITNVWAYIYDSNNSIVLSREYNPNEASHNLRYSVNNDFAFGNLPVGTYTYIVEAKAVNGDQAATDQLINSGFKVNPPNKTEEETTYNDIVSSALAKEGKKASDFGFNADWCTYFAALCGTESFPALFPQSYTSSHSATPKDLAVWMANNKTGILYYFYKDLTLTSLKQNNTSLPPDYNEQYYVSTERNSFLPQRGDLILLRKNTSSFNWQHIGIVISCESGNVKYISGNTHGIDGGPYWKTSCVAVDSIASSNERITGYIRPLYSGYVPDGQNNGKTTFPDGTTVIDIHAPEYGAPNIIEGADISLHDKQQNMIVNVGAGSTLRFCSYVSLDNAYEIGSIPNDAIVYVYGTTTQQYDGRTWAKINYNGTDGWVNVAWLAPYTEQTTAVRVTPTPALTYEKPILSISENNAPAELSVGSNFGLRGIIQTNCGTITNVYAYIYDSNANLVQSREYTPNESSHNLRYSVNNDFAFGKMSAGTYRYIVEAKAVNGDQSTATRLIDASFRINGESAPDPVSQVEPQIQSVGNNMQVAVGTGSTLRFCSYVSLDNAHEIGSIPNDAIVYVYGTTTQQYEDRTWAKINYNGTDGWVNVAWLVPYTSQPVTEPSAPANSIDISEYVGQWTAGMYYSDRDFYDDMLTIEQVRGNEISVKWELYRIAGFTETVSIDPNTGIAQFQVNASWTGSGVCSLKLENGTVSLTFESSSMPYVYAGDVHVYAEKRAVPSRQQEAVAYDPPVLSISGNNVPSDMTVGSNFGIRGIIQTSCGTITHVQAYILDSNYSPVQASEYTPNEASVDLRYTVNNDLVFGKLPAGSYVYYVEATAVNGDETTNEALINVGFTVIAPAPEPESQPEPAIQQAGYDMLVNVGEGSTLRFCSTASVADKYEIGSIPNAQTVYVYGVTTQQYENRTWAKINYLGVDGWVNYDWLTNVPQAVVAPEPQQEAAPQSIIQQYDTPMLSISGNNVPSDMTVGSNFGIRGIVETSSGTITNVQAYILDSNYNAIQASEYTPNESALDLRYSINNDLVFGRLAAGSYVYYVEATAVNGDKTTNETLINVSFNVIAPTPEPQPEPSIQMVGYDMVVNVGNGSTLRFCSAVSRADEYEIGSIPNAQTVYVYGITTQQYEGRTWAKVNYLGVDGWVNYEWLATIPVETPQPIMQPTPEPTPIPQPDLPGYRLATKLDTNYVLDIAGQGVSNGDNLQLSRNNNSKSQGFDLTELGSGYWRITNSNSGLDLTAEASGVSGSNVYQWEYTGADTQQWYFTENADGSYLISNKASGCFLDVANAWANDGTNIGLFTRNDAYNAQSWYIQAAYLA